jgi:hypothetical protein
VTDELDLRRTAIRVLGLALVLGIIAMTLVALFTDLAIGSAAGLLVALAAAIAGLAGLRWSRPLS